LYLIRCYVGVGFEVLVKQTVSLSRSSKNSIKEKKATSAEENKRKRKRRGDTNGTRNNNTGKKKSKRGGNVQENDDRDEEDGEEAKRDQEHVVGGEIEDSNNLDWTDLESYISMLEEGPLCPLNFDPDDNGSSTGRPDTKSGSKWKSTSKADNDTIPMPLGPDGLRYHIMDVWLDELMKVLELNSEESKEDANTTVTPMSNNSDIPIDIILRPFVRLQKESPMKKVRQRAGEVLDDGRLLMWGFREAKKVDEEDESVKDDGEWGGFED
jgi:ribosomal RNA-processing protein 1